ncbi:MAG TPA: hypothetical protein P5257_05005 [Bacteroidales bacterium]|nr:hypothetical protein [Bacteroidales bacterium]
MHERFKFRNPEDLLSKAESLGLRLPFSDDISPLLQPAALENKIIPNRFVVQPMEGYDSEADGTPSDLTRRRYMRYSSGGSGIVWFEAIAVDPDGRSNPRQLMLTEKNLGIYKKLISGMRENHTGKHPQLLAAQITHSGRYSRPAGGNAPLVPSKNALLDRGNERILSDEELFSVQKKFIKTAKLAFDAGFDAVDIKACHGYLIHELLFSFNREKSLYGGRDPEGRFRFLLETIERTRENVPGIIVTTRINLCDLYAGGFGTTPDGKGCDLSEALLLTGELEKRGVKIINTTMGSPYFNPHVVRPYDNPLPGAPVPPEHPLEGVVRMTEGTGTLQKNYPGIMIIGSAYSWLRHFSLNVGAGVLKEGLASFIGFGRNSFAYPGMPRDIIRNGAPDKSKFCITCSGCTRLMKDLRPAGCVIHDREIYGAELKKLIADGR